MAKIISFSNQKGGVGKTSTCVNLSAALALKGKKTLLIDMDPQGNATTGLGFSKSELEHSVYNVLIDDIPAEKAIQHTAVDNLDILPASIDLAGAEVELVYLKNREKRLAENPHPKRILRNGRFITTYEHHKIGCYAS